MPISSPRPGVMLLVTGVLAGIAAAGCSKDASKENSVALRSDTSTSIASTESTATPPNPAPKSPPVKPQPLGVSNPPRTSPTRADRAAAKAATPAQVPNAGPDKWLSYDPATNTVTFELIAGPFNFNGYRNGEATLVLPPKANVVINFVNKDGTPHSAIVISGEGPIPNSATDPAIPRAYTNKVLEGLPQEASDAMRFPVPESGTYRILCGVPGHGPAGMWIWMKVDPAAKTPSFGPTKT